MDSNLLSRAKVRSKTCCNVGNKNSKEKSQANISWRRTEWRESVNRKFINLFGGRPDEGLPQRGIERIDDSTAPKSH